MSSRPCFWCREIQRRIDLAKALKNGYWQGMEQSNLELHQKLDHGAAT